MSRLNKVAKNPGGESSKEELLRSIIEETIAEVYDGSLSSRDVSNMADAILDEEREYLRELRERIENNMKKDT